MTRAIIANPFSTELDELDLDLAEHEATSSPEARTADDGHSCSTDMPRAAPRVQEGGTNSDCQGTSGEVRRATRCPETDDPCEAEGAGTASATPPAGGSIGLPGKPRVSADDDYVMVPCSVDAAFGVDDEDLEGGAS